MLKNLIILICFAVLVSGCSKNDKKEIIASPIDEREEVQKIYNEAVIALKKGDAYFASKKFKEAEGFYPSSEWAAKAALMSAFALYSANFYSDSIFNLERYIKQYPSDKNIPYAHYLIGICYYEQILDEKKDLRPTLKAKEKFEYIVEKFPNTDYALDVKFKLDLVTDLLAAKEMYVARHYLKSEKWIPAINRFKIVVENYDRTIFVEEALHRLVEIYYKIGLFEEAKKIASILGYNYGSGEWYEKSYKVFNKNYKPIKIEKEKDGLILKKIKGLFE